MVVIGTKGLANNIHTAGLKGKVIRIDPIGSYEIAVEFEKEILGGHNAGGFGKEGHCYLGHFREVEELISSKTVPLSKPLNVLLETLEETAKKPRRTRIANKDEFEVSPRVSLPIRKGDVTFVPKSEDFIDQKALVERVALAVNMKMPVLLIGETGTGKTSLVRYLASKTNNGFRRVNHNGGTTVEDVVGKILVASKEGTYWVDGVLVDAMRHGHWYLADEINASAAEINFMYHSLLDDDGYVVLTENKGEIVRPHEDFRFFAGMNPTDTHSGTKEVNQALMSRFAVFKIDYVSPKAETEILTTRTKVPEEVARRMTTFAAEVRTMFQKEKIDFPLSTRDLIIWSKLIVPMKKFIPAAEIAILNKVGRNDIDAIKDLLSIHFASIDDGKVASDSFEDFTS